MYGYLRVVQQGMIFIFVEQKGMLNFFWALSFQKVVMVNKSLSLFFFFFWNPSHFVSQKTSHWKEPSPGIWFIYKNCYSLFLMIPLYTCDKAKNRDFTFCLKLLTKPYINPLISALANCLFFVSWEISEAQDFVLLKPARHRNKHFFFN